MSPEQFQQIVDKTLDELPEEFKKAIENVGVVVEDWPTREDFQMMKLHPGSLLFGLYRGVPKTKRGNYYSGVLPDKIVIFAGPILSTSKDINDAMRRIKDTILHELGHHFGLTDKQIRNAKRK